MADLTCCALRNARGMGVSALRDNYLVRWMLDNWR